MKGWVSWQDMKVEFDELKKIRQQGSEAEQCM